MKYTEHALNILTTKTFKGIGHAWINQNLSSVLEYEIIIDLLSKKIGRVTKDEFLRQRDIIREKIEKLSNSCDGVIAVGDKSFISHRGKVKDSDKPIALFYKGDLSLISKKKLNIAVIGVLTPDPNTEIDERKIVRKLVENNAVIVSGLAFGCDSIAHDETLKAGGATVAILPSAINNIQPSKNKVLAQNIIDNGGLLISEYFEEPASKIELGSRYIARDRLQALFSDLVILCSSYTPNSYDPNSSKIDSGSRHAMSKAKEYDIKRAVIYSDFYKNNPKYDLNRKILTELPSSILIEPNNFEKALTEILSIKNNKIINDKHQGCLF